MKNVSLVFGGKPEIYNELLNAFDLSFKELGYKTKIINLGKSIIKTDFFLTDAFNVVVDAYCRIKPTNKNNYNVLLHLENNTRNDFDNWSKVLHISPLKICKKSIYFPFGYSKAFDYQFDIAEINEDIDVSFFGTLTKHRQNFIKQISDKHNIVIFNRSGKHIPVVNRDTGIAKSKINLTIKSFDNCVFEQVRSNLILSKGKLLFAEENYNGGYGYMKDYLIPFNVNNFDILVDKYLDDNFRKEFTDYVKNELQTKHNFTKYIKEIIL